MIKMKMCQKDIALFITVFGKKILRFGKGDGRIDDKGGRIG